MDEELLSLARKLRDESTFVQSEKKHLLELYRQLLKKSEQLFQKQWIVARQHSILEDLILGRNKFTIAQCCSKFSSFANKSQFVESHKLVGSHHDYKVTEFLKSMRERPDMLASLLVKSERSGSGGDLVSPQSIIAIAVQSLYGNCSLVQDELYALQLLKYLVELQFAADEQQTVTDLRRLIRKPSCSFNVLFKLYTSFAHSTQLFLTAALYEPITQILNSEWLLDIDPEKALSRFSSDEITQRFGQANSKEYKSKTQKYRDKIVNQLHTYAMMFVDSLKSNLFSFPTSLAWLVNHLYNTIVRNNNKRANFASAQDMARKLCCDLIMALYICPAICDPEPYGILHDIHISSVARHNLMQIANILQVLAMSDDDKDPKAQDLYSKFRNNCLSDILNKIITLIDSNSYSAGDQQSNNNTTTSNLSSLPAAVNGDGLVGLVNGDAAVAISSETQQQQQQQLQHLSSLLFHQQGANNNSNNGNNVQRSSLMVSQTDMHKLLFFTRQQLSKEPGTASSEETKWLRSILPTEYISHVLDTTSAQLQQQQQLEHQQRLQQQQKELHQQRKVSTAAIHASSSSNSLHSAVIAPPDEAQVLASLITLTGDSLDQILVFNMNTNTDCPGMKNEEKVLSEYETALQHAKRNQVAMQRAKHHHHHKHHYHRHQRHFDDEDEIENQSSVSSVSHHHMRHHHHHHRHHRDRMEDVSSSSFQRPVTSVGGGLGSVEGGISEVGAGAETVSSSDEEDENGPLAKDKLVDDDDDDVDVEAEGAVPDGLSDFDNISGRDTPIMSGRDTPSSQHSGPVHVGGGGGDNITTGSSSRHVTAGDSVTAMNTLLNSASSGGGGGSSSAGMMANSTTAAVAASNTVNSNRQQHHHHHQQQQHQHGHARRHHYSSSSSTAGGGGPPTNSSAVTGNMHPQRGPQLPITVQKANREDINDKFCKFEINKINASVKEEQLSEAWSLDADPPESVINEPLNDPLNGLLDESANSTTQSSFSGIALAPATSSSAATTTSLTTTATTSTTTSISLTNASSSRANNSDHDLISAATTAAAAAASAATNQSPATAPVTFSLPPVDSVNNLIVIEGDHASLASSTGAVGGNKTADDMEEEEEEEEEDDDDEGDHSKSEETDSDSADDEEDSPSKGYTPYSTYSSVSSSHNQYNLVDVSPALLATTASTNQSTNNNASTDLIDLGTNSVRSIDSGLNSYQTTTNTSIAALNADFLSLQLPSAAATTTITTTITTTSSTTTTTTSNHHHHNLSSSLIKGGSKLTSIFSHSLSSHNSSSNNASSSVKFSNASLQVNVQQQQQQQQKRSGFHRFFNKSSKNKDNTSSTTTATNASDPFASLNPFAQQQQQQPPMSMANPIADQSTTTQQETSTSVSDNIDNILKKYQKQSSVAAAAPPAQPPAPTPPRPTSSPPATSIMIPSINNEQPNVLIDLSSPTKSNDGGSNNSKEISLFDQRPQHQQQSTAVYDPNNLAETKAFQDAKKKLRMVLGWSDYTSAASFCCFANKSVYSHTSAKENFISMYLKTQLYDAISLQDKEHEAQLYETLRCVSIFNELECSKLVRSLRREYTRRDAYVSYLLRSKQHLLYALQLVERLLRRAEWHQQLCAHHLASVVTRVFMESKEMSEQMTKFVADFRSLVALDEKFDLFKRCMHTLQQTEYDAIWTGCEDSLIQIGHVYLERLLMSKVYVYALYPNGEIDHHRDTKVSECLAELASVITPSHPLIGIPTIYHQECPWTAAQMELRRINIYKTPQDKLACIRKCMLTIQNLLAIAKSPVCADDLNPVLIYVIIKANPPTFLSNVQYIEGFYGSQLEMEDYYWSQFKFAFSYIRFKLLKFINQ